MKWRAENWFRILLQCSQQRFWISVSVIKYFFFFGCTDSRIRRSPSKHAVSKNGIRIKEHRYLKSVVGKTTVGMGFVCYTSDGVTYYFNTDWFRSMHLKVIGYYPESSVRFLLWICHLQKLNNYRIPLAHTSFFVWVNTSVLGNVNCSFCDKHLWRSGGLATPTSCCFQFSFKFFTLKVYASASFVNTLIAQVFRWHWLGRECSISPATDWELIIIMVNGFINAVQYWVSTRKPTVYTFTNGGLMDVMQLCFQ